MKALRVSRCVDVAAGQRHSLALSEKGLVLAFGAGGSGQLGSGGIAETEPYPKAGGRRGEGGEGGVKGGEKVGEKGGLDGFFGWQFPVGRNLGGLAVKSVGWVGWGVSRWTLRVCEAGSFQ